MHMQWRAQVATGKTCTVTLTSLHFRQSENSSVQRLTNTVLKVLTVIAKMCVQTSPMKNGTEHSTLYVFSCASLRFHSM